MIKINLLGAPKPKRGKGRAASTAMVEMGGGGGAGPNPLMTFGITIAIALGAFYYTYNQAQRTAAQIKSDMVKAETENRRLAAVKAKYDQEQKVKENYERRVKVIDDLRANQSGPVNLLAMIGDTVNSTDAVWLVDMQDQGSSIKLDGTALSANAVANLIKNLQKTGFFKSVELNETTEGQTADVATFTFSLTCAKQTS
jgi:type IV pilus assembly protein PilN